jgi:predicted nucleotidyltransferase
MLTRALRMDFEGYSASVARPEDIIGLKLQALANDATRPSDAADIRELLRLHLKTMDLELVREYFQLFGREAELDAILETL